MKFDSRWVLTLLTVALFLIAGFLEMNSRHPVGIIESDFPHRDKITAERSPELLRSGDLLLSAVQARSVSPIKTPSAHPSAEQWAKLLEKSPDLRSLNDEITRHVDCSDIKRAVLCRAIALETLTEGAGHFESGHKEFHDEYWYASREDPDKVLEGLAQALRLLETAPEELRSGAAGLMIDLKRAQLDVLGATEIELAYPTFPGKKEFPTLTEGESS